MEISRNTIALEIPLRLLIDEAAARKCFNEMREPGDSGTYVQYLAEWVEGIVDDVTGGHNFGYSVVLA